MAKAHIQKFGAKSGMLPCLFPWTALYTRIRAPPTQQSRKTQSYLW